jgi:hypothetical protein
MERVRRRSAPSRTAVLFGALLAPLGAGAAPAAAQEAGEFRVGVSLGGTALLALVLERLDEHAAVELSVGTWSFRDLSASAVVRGYLGASAFRPVVGAGLWAILAPPQDAARWGTALVARFPIGFDWRLAPDHFVDLDFNVNRALWIRRRDEELRPVNRRLVPIPGVSYRWAP